MTNVRFVILIVAFGGLFSAGVIRGWKASPTSSAREANGDLLALQLAQIDRVTRERGGESFEFDARINGIASRMSGARRSSSPAAVAEKLRQDLAARGQKTLATPGPGCTTVLGVDVASGRMIVHNVYPDGNGSFVSSLEMDSRDIQKVDPPKALRLPNVEEELTIVSEDAARAATTVSASSSANVTNCHERLERHFRQLGWNLESLDADGGPTRHFAARRGTQSLTVSLSPKEVGHGTHVLVVLENS